LISDVNPNSPAERAGLKSGDIVTKIDDRPVLDSRALQLMIGEMSPGRNARLTIMRDGKEREYAVSLGEQPVDRASTGTLRGYPGEDALEGVSLEQLTSEFSRQYGIAANTKGIAVRRVDPNSAAGEAGLEQGDVIMEVNRKPVSTVEELNRSINEGKMDTALILVNHAGHMRYLVIPTK